MGIECDPEYFPILIPPDPEFSGGIGREGQAGIGYIWKNKSEG